MWYLELSPGVFATPLVLSRMLAIVEEEKRLCMLADDMPAFGLPNRTVVHWKESTKIAGRIRITVEIAIVEEADYTANHRHAFDKTYPATSEGLLAGMVESKEAQTNLRRGLCEQCLALTPPQKKMKGKGFAVCGGCAVSAAFGCKRSY